MRRQQEPSLASKGLSGTSRRDFLKTGSLSFLGLFLCHDLVWACDTTLSYLLQQLPEGMEMRSPNKVATLKAKDFQQLWSIFNWIGRKWDDKEFCLVGEKELKSTLSLKTSSIPSYFTEYCEAAKILRCLTAELEEQKALEQLFFVPADTTNFYSTRLGHIRQFVITEFIRYQVSQGAFRKFGYMNYRGYAGGPYSDPARLPYRGLHDA